MASSPYDQIVQDSLSLSSEQRGELAAILLESLATDLPTGQQRSTDEWNDEIARRSEELGRGTAALLNADDSIAQARARLNELKH